MKRRLFILPVLLFSFGALFGQTSPNAVNLSTASARILPQGRWQVGVFQPLRYGLSPTVELSAHPLWFFIIPNLSAKWAHGCSCSDLKVATRHSIVYPSPLLRTMAKKGTGGIISPEFTIPSVLIFNNELLVSRDFSAVTATFSLGVGLAVRSGNLDERTTIDLPIVYPRLNVLYHGYRLYSGVDAQGHLYKKLSWQADVNFFYCPPANGAFAFEQKSLLLLNKSDHFQVCGGYLLTYGEYPFGTQWHLLPLFDLQWAWH
jgi:hypothetical protein